MFNRLVEFERGTTEIVPALAESWGISTDGRVYRFHYVATSAPAARLVVRRISLRPRSVRASAFPLIRWPEVDIARPVVSNLAVDVFLLEGGAPQLGSTNDGK